MGRRRKDVDDMRPYSRRRHVDAYIHDKVYKNDPHAERCSLTEAPTSADRKESTFGNSGECANFNVCLCPGSNTLHYLGNKPADADVFFDAEEFPMEEEYVEHTATNSNLSDVAFDGNDSECNANVDEPQTFCDKNEISCDTTANGSESSNNRLTVDPSNKDAQGEQNFETDMYSNEPCPSCILADSLNVPVFSGNCSDDPDSSNEEEEEVKYLFSDSEEDNMDSGNESDYDTEREATPAPDKPEKNTAPSKLSTFILATFITTLANWALRYSITRDGFDALLKILRTVPGLGSLPKCAKTVLPSTKNISASIKKLADGALYFHFGIEACLMQLLSSLPQELIGDEIKLLFFVDGLSVFKSSGSELWPILCTVQNIPIILKTVMPIGFYYAAKKPTDAAFLQFLVNELKVLIERGIIVNGKKILIRVQGFCADAPAKALILGIKGHNGYFSCTRCRERGSRTGARTHFNERTLQTPRTNDDFLDGKYKNYQTKKTPLVEIPGLHFVFSFCLDVMHLVFLGVTRTLLKLKTSPKQTPLGFKLCPSKIDGISKILIGFKKHVPSEFARKPRDMTDLPRYKATELRLFLLYTGALALHAFLSPEEFLNFLSLQVAMRILLQPNPLENKVMFEYAKKLLDYFVFSFEACYGEKFISHNFHALRHVTDDIYFFGSLDACSAFKFENYMGFIKTLITKKNKILEQIARKLTMLHSNDTLFRKSNVANDEPQFFRRKKSKLEESEYEKLYFKGYLLKTDKPDNCIQLKNGKIMLITNIYRGTESKPHHFSGFCFRKTEELFESPCKSSSLNIFKVRNLSVFKEQCQLGEMAHKSVLLPVPDKIDEFASYPLLHSSLD